MRNTLGRLPCPFGDRETEMTDEQYLERLNALDETALLSYAIGERVNATDQLRKKEFRRDTVKLDAIIAALGKANIRMEQIT
jgi:hypothetical protein